MRRAKSKKTELDAWREHSKSSGIPMPSNMLLSADKEAKVKEKHEKDRAADIERTNLRTQSQQGETKSVSVAEDNTYKCRLCLDDYVYFTNSGDWTNGCLCRGTCADAPHFFCTDCFRRHILIDACIPGGRYEKEMEIQGGISRPGEFPCPSAHEKLTAATADGCDCGAIEIMDIYRVLQGDAPSFEQFDR